MSNWSVATWRAQSLFSGDPQAFVDFHKSVGAEAICLKVGNGWYPWEGLEPFIVAAKLAGLKAWGYWYLYANRTEEGRIMGDHAEAIGLDGLALDVEREWEKRAGLTQSGRNKTAERTMRDLKATFSGELALCSWWHAEGNHKVPYKIFLEACDWNMPQHYWMGRFSDAGAVDVVTRSLDMYSRIANWPASKTIPVLSSFGQTVRIRDKDVWWKATITQMKAAYFAAIGHGCPSVNWWSLDYLQGGSGHEYPKVVEKKFIETIRSFSTVEPEPPSPADLLHAIAGRIRDMAGSIDDIAGAINHG